MKLTAIYFLIGIIGTSVIPIIMAFSKVSVEEMLSMVYTFCVGLMVIGYPHKKN
jgi:hypothetical protein